ncbi:MAG: malonate--CoA ligase [Burkholderiales bacterium]
MNNQNLFVTLRDAFPADLDATAIEQADGELLHYTWRDIERATAMLANWLTQLDLSPDARIAVHCDKSVEALLLYLAVLRGGWVYVPLNNAYHASELEHFIRDAQPSVVVCASKHFGWVSKLAFTNGVPHVFTLNDDRTGTLLDRASFQPDQHLPAIKASADLAAILYTSGTTGRSKGAMLSHGNLRSNALTLKTLWGWRCEQEGGDVLIHALPIFHVHGLFVASHGALINGSKMLWLSKFDPALVISLLPRATVFMGVPTLYVRLLEKSALAPEVCATMRLFISGSAPLLPDTFEAFFQRTGQRILERYGMSETLMLTSNPYAPQDGERRAGTVGRALPGVEVRVVNDGGLSCAVGEAGHVQVRGPNVFSGYWRLPEKTAEEFTADGWFKTGDVGHLDTTGVLTLVGRSKDLIISGGFNVYPAEVEAALNVLPGVLESAVVGVDHPDFGEGVLAVVVPQAGAALDGAVLMGLLKTQLAAFKVPKQIVVVSELPRNAMGKVQKNLLRERYKTALLRA